MEEPNSPKAWANFLVTVWGDRFPIKVRTIALEYSKRFPDPLKDITPASVGATFEGLFIPYGRAANGQFCITLILGSLAV